MEIGAYVDWQDYVEAQKTGASDEPAGTPYFPLYVEISNSSKEGLKEGLEKFILLLDDDGDEQKPQFLRVEFHELEMLKFYLQIASSSDDKDSSISMGVYAFVYVLKSRFVAKQASALLNLCKVLHVGPSVLLGNRREFSAGFLPTLGVQTETVPGKPIFAIIDDGIAFLNRRFTRTDANPEEPNPNDSIKTRFESVWLQSRERISEIELDIHQLSDIAQVWTGRVFEREDIEALLGNGLESNVYTKINSTVYPDQPHRSVAFADSHGTHVADLACGTEPGNLDDPLNDVDMLAVQLPPGSIRDTVGKRLDINIMQSIRWILYRAYRMSEKQGSSREFANRPLVINISLGVTAGPKDGSGFLETHIARNLDLFQKITNNTPVKVVQAFGNEYANQQIALIDTAKHDTNLLWRIQPDDRSANYLEIRPENDSTLEIQIKPPGGAAVMVPKLNEGEHTNLIVNGQIAGRVYNEPIPIGSEQTAKATYVVATLPTVAESGGTAPAGAWKVSLSSKNGMKDQFVSLQIQRGDTPVGYRRLGRQSYFEDNREYGFDIESRNYSALALPTKTDIGTAITENGTHSALASSLDDSIVSVGSTYIRTNSMGVNPKHTWYSAAGSLNHELSNVTEPDYSAPGEETPIRGGILGAGTLSNTTKRMSGTSVSAPQVSRMFLLQYLGIDNQVTQENDHKGNSQLARFILEHKSKNVRHLT